MPDLDLIKQEEQGQALGLRLREDDEFVRPQFLCVRREEEKGDAAMNCPNESEH